MKDKKFEATKGCGGGLGKLEAKFRRVGGLGTKKTPL